MYRYSIAILSLLVKTVRMINKIYRTCERVYDTANILDTALQVGTGLYVGGHSFVSKTTQLGDDVNFNGMRIYDGGCVTIGSHFHSGKNCKILTSFHDYDGGDSLPYGTNYVEKDVVIGNYVWLGEGVTVLGGVTIGDGVIIQAYSTVVSDIPPLAIAGGHPARVFKFRNAEHYQSLLTRLQAKLST